MNCKVTWFLENNRALSKFLYGILHYLISAIKLQQNQSIKNNFISTTLATLRQFRLRIFTGKKHLQIKLGRFRKAWIWHQSNSLYQILKLKQNFRKNKLVTDKFPFFVISPFCTLHSIYLNIGFWQSSFAWKWWVFNLSTFD